MPKMTDSARADVAKATRIMAKRFTDEMQRRNLTQADLARATGMDRTVLNRMLTGRRGLNFASYIKLCDALDIPRSEASELQGVQSQPGGGLGEMLHEHRDDIAPREARFLRGVRFVVSPSDQPDCSPAFWLGLLALYRLHPPKR